MERFESELGDVELKKQYFERKRKSSELWDEIDSAEALDKVHLSKIHDLRRDADAEPPYVAVKISDGWKKVYFQQGEEVESFYKRLNYFWKSFNERSS